MKKGSIHQDLITINICVPNFRAPKYIRQILTELKGELINNTIIVGDFNAQLSIIDKSSKERVNRKTANLNVIEQMDLIDIQRKF